jgi:hypothetical protein
MNRRECSVGDYYYIKALEAVGSFILINDNPKLLVPSSNHLTHTIGGPYYIALLHDDDLEPLT